jgi:antitoxin ParD1/3/4
LQPSWNRGNIAFMDVEIPSDLNPFVQQMISCGAYRDENELLIEGLRLLRSREQLRADVNAGIDQLQSGEGLDGDEVFARLEERARRLGIRAID